MIVMAPLLRVLSPEVREDWTLLGDDFSTVFPFLAQCLARQWLQDICSKVVAWHAAAIGQVYVCWRKRKYKCVWITNVHVDALWETLAATVATCSCASPRMFWKNLEAQCRLALQSVILLCSLIFGTLQTSTGITDLW